MAIVTGHQAAIGAAAALAPIPIVGPALAAAAYDKWMTITYLNAALMAAVAVGQGMSGGGGGAVPASDGYQYGSNTQSSWQPTAAPAKAAPVINIIVYGNIVDQDAFAREMVPSLTKALEDNVH